MKYLELLVEIHPSRTLTFPQNPVNTLRGALGYQLKRVVCFQRNRQETGCRGCLAKRTCAYATNFETAAGDGNKFVAGGGGDSPHPLVLGADFSGPRICQPGENVSFRFTLFGRAIETLPFITHALREVCDHGLSRELVPCGLNGIIDAVTGQRLYDPATHSLQPFTARDIEVAEPTGFRNDVIELTLLFDTPTSFKDKASGKIVNRPDFHRIVRSILRRHSAMIALDGLPSPTWDYGSIIRQAEAVRLVGSQLETVFWERVSSRQHQRTTWGGILGKATYHGDLQPFLPLLRVGELLHVGRGTIFGQGCFRIGKLSACEEFSGDRPTIPDVLCNAPFAGHPDSSEIRLPDSHT
ncbi:MAG: CRISPR system precrRNA processing endoribonuclease RAMP protein Cas6 [Candidatus Riflebacteria bacterium]|nr:CRISPR system precrRNA processing endoribonuclease RAMP protein Cas6 [Candidatus Riflebacteria bacterium]